jgi:hypothetical protein
VGNTANYGGSATNGTASAARGVAILNCSTPNCSVSISASPVGVGFSYPPSSVWNGQLTYNNTCLAETAPCPAVLPEPSPSGADGYYSWDPVNCMYVWHKLGNTPIIVDTDGLGFHLTSAADGIVWDFFGDGHPIQIAWTQLGSTNGWLALAGC